ERLELGQVHAWYRATDANAYHGYQTMLSSDERARCDRFYFVRDRRDYANAHHLLRTTLSRYEGRSPAEWRFDTTSYGKPFLADDSPGADGQAPLTFNLSHTCELVACVVGRGTTVGIDVERLDRLHDVLDLATRFFSPLEVAGLHGLEDEERPRRFGELWTLKESFIKAIGKGLSQPLNSFTFDLSEAGTIRFTPPPEYAHA